MKKLVLILLLLTSIVTFAQSLDDKNGFRDYKFGMNTSNFTNLKLEDSIGLIKYYTKLDEKKTISGFQSEKIVYGFYKNHLSIISIYIQSQDNTTGILKMLQDKYGKGIKPYSTENYYFWLGKKVMLAFSHDSIYNSKLILLTNEYGHKL